MSQRIISCPQCGQTHKVECFHNGGTIVSIVSVNIPNCTFFTERPSDIARLTGMDIEDVFEQRVRDMEMPSEEPVHITLDDSHRTRFYDDGPDYELGGEG